MPIGWLLFAAAVIGMVVRGGVDHAVADYRRSRAARVAAAGPSATPRQRARVARQHRVAYWARESLTGFPVFRSGVWAAWYAHKAAHAQARARIEEARTRSIEQEAAFAQSLPDHRSRQAHARLILAEVGQQMLDADPPVRGRRGVRGVVDTVARIYQFPERPKPPEDDDPAPAAPVSAQPQRPEPGPYAPKNTAPAPEQDAPAEPEGEPAVAGTADVTFRDVESGLKDWAAERDVETGIIAQREAQARALIDGLHANDVDPQLLAAVMAKLDALAVRRKAIVAEGDADDMIAAALSKYRQTQEAIDDAGVRTAERAFHSGS